jgi:hypothetical protein
MFGVSSVQATSQGGKNQLLLIMDEYTCFCWSIFPKKKSDLPISMLTWFYAFQKSYGSVVPCFCCDHALEHGIFHT